MNTIEIMRYAIIALFVVAAGLTAAVVELNKQLKSLSKIVETHTNDI